MVADSICLRESADSSGDGSQCPRVGSGECSIAAVGSQVSALLSEKASSEAVGFRHLQEVGPGEIEEAIAARDDDAEQQSVEAFISQNQFGGEGNRGGRAGGAPQRGDEASVNACNADAPVQRSP